MRLAQERAPSPGRKCNYCKNAFLTKRDLALKVGTELVKSLRYKLQMMGVPIEGAANVLVDNTSVVKNSTIPSSTLQKKHNSICYHYVREAVAARLIRIAYVPSTENLADVFTKPMGASKLRSFIQRILY